MRLSEILPLDKRWAAIGIATFGCVFLYRGIFRFDPSLYTPSDIEPIEDWFFSPAGSSPFLILGLTAWFTIRRLPHLSASRAGISASIAGFVGVFVAMALVVWSSYVAAAQILPLSISILLLSAGMAFGGFRGGRSLLMPALFVALLGTPVPTPLLNAIIYPMQLWTASVSTAIVQGLGQPVQHSGDLIFSPSTVFQVIETCAGFRSMMTLTMAAFVYGELIGLRTSRRILLILLAPAIGLFVNFLRVVSLVLIPNPESQPDHSLQGIAMVVLGVLFLWQIDELADRFSRGREATESIDPPPQDRASTVPIWVVALTLVSTGILTLLIEPWQPTPTSGRGVHTIPREIGDWRAGQEPLSVDTEYLGSVRFSSRTSRRYRRGDESIDVFVGRNDRILRTVGLVSRKTQTLDSGSIVVAESSNTSSGARWKPSELIVRRRDGRNLLVHHGYENIQTLGCETFRAALALDRGPWRRQLPAHVVRLATPIDSSEKSRGAARLRLEEFSDLLSSHVAVSDGNDDDAR